ncbi:hypothetical protein Tsubulata_043394 [Turnera subulata]|uniref:SHSP domain-containing protein n=1 Tax=Turnera subulata TaxID=218843 RepID=A0A9Q0G5V6_9ROSI|nr:hypothetical protein Tsubulata_043394 [Turnera subulata]
MIPRGGYRGSLIPNRQQQANSARVVRPRRDESFQPKSDVYREADGTLVFRIHVPGFVKEEIKVNVVESLSYISVQGEKRRIDNSRLRFNTFHSIPVGYNLSQATTQLDGGIFTIRIPKKKSASVETSPVEREASSSQKSAPRPEEGSTGKPEEGKVTEVKDINPSMGKAENGSTSQKGQDGAPQEARVLVDVAGTNVAEKTERPDSGGGIVDQKAVESQADQKQDKTGKPEKVAGLTLVEVKGNGEKSEGSPVAESGNLNKEGMEKENTEPSGVVPGREENHKSDKYLRITKSENHHSAIGGAHEKKELLINICAAATVIVALGGYIIHNKFG